MVWMLALIVAAGGAKTIEVRHTDVAPRIDGHIEEVWQAADSVDDFVQFLPDEGVQPSERTVVYVLQDNANLYVAFRAWSLGAPPVGQLYGVEDELTLYLDPTDSRQSGYFFKAYASGLWRSGLIFDNGGGQDWSWEGVWYVNTVRYPDRIECEMRIPFKSIRWRPAASEWGINFQRLIARNNEYISWIDVRERTGGNLVSCYGRLEGIRPEARGYYFELLPEGYLRYEQKPGADASVVARPSLNLKWDVTPQTTVNATALPDFAQIESDPYSFNLSRYPVLLAERRPFFVEGSENFRLAGLGQMSDFQPLRLFYSRSIGRAVRNEPVPILGGLKLTSRGSGWSMGALGAYTDDVTDTTGTVEPRRGFGVLTGRRQFGASNLGLLLSGTAANGEEHNAALGLDWGFSSGPHRAAVELAGSEDNKRLGWALNSGYTGFVRNWYASGALQVVDDSFSVQDVGYVPWAGRRSLSAAAGPTFDFRGPVRRLYVVPGFYTSREPGSDKYSWGGTISVIPQFRSQTNLQFSAGAGHTFEADTDYISRFASLGASGGDLSYGVNANVSYSYAYNYARGFVAPNASASIGATYYPFGRVALMLGLADLWEFDPNGRVLSVSTMAQPKIDFRINSRVSFNVYDEMVLATPETRFGETDFIGNRVGFLFSWNFLPKSWLYVALNDFRFDTGSGLQLVDRVGAVKLRYLIYI